MATKMTLRDRSENTEPTGGRQSDGRPFRFEINLFEMARLILSRKRLVLGLSLAIMLVTAAYMFAQANRYTSTAVILPSGKSSGNMSALKSLVGLGGPVSFADENSSALFPLILQSNLVVDAVANTVYTFAHGGREQTTSLKDYFGLADRDMLRRATRQIATVRTDRRTGEIVIGVETEFPALSQAVLRQYLTQLENFNLHKRRSSARENETYLARQLDVMRADLAVAETRLEAYQQNNLNWAATDSPEILKELGQLRREVDAKSSTYLMLLQQYEMAKLDAQKDVPIVSILDSPSLPTQKSGPFRRNIILLSGFFAFLLISFALILWQIIRQGLSGKNEADFVALRRQIKTTFPRTHKTLDRLKTLRADKSAVMD